MSDTLIRVDGVSKKFCRRLRTSLWYGLQDVGAELLGRPHRSEGALREDEFWAVQDVSFALRRGECVGLIGHNGAGKTTLLRMLNGLIRPDRGRIEIRGRVGALIALGAGFHPSLTGRENVFVNAAILGLSREEAGRRFDEIVEFSGLEQHIDSPVQNYSSGMFVRLGFAVAAHVEPDVLLVDEALAVGDLAFTIKCLNKIAQLRHKGCGVVFVSHSEIQVREAATRCLLMNSGRLVSDGGVDAAYIAYDMLRPSIATDIDPDVGFVHAGLVEVLNARVVSSDGGVVRTGAAAQIHVECDSACEMAGARFQLRFWNSSGQLVTSVDSVGMGQYFNLSGGRTKVVVSIPRLPLVPGRYRLAGGFRRDGEILAWVRDLALFCVEASQDIEFGAGLFMLDCEISTTSKVN